MKPGRPTKFNEKPRAPRTSAGCVTKQVVPRRAIVLTYPEITLCFSCHATNIDRLDKISDEYDDHRVRAQKEN